MPLKIEKNPSRRAFQHVVDQIQGNIINGNLKPGDVLPPELKLKELFNVSRPSIREALRVLEQRGLIIIKSGAKGGAVVIDASTSNITENLDLLMQLKKVQIQDLNEYRAHVEPIVAALAAERATLADIERLNILKAEADRIAQKEDVTLSNYQPIDVAMHMLIAEIARNPLFEASLKMIHNKMVYSKVIYPYDSIHERSKDLIMKNIKDFSELVEAIEQRSPEKAKSVMKRHLSDFRMNNLKTEE
jgi:DNA-binding FadR family transcriptional regulator